MKHSFIACCGRTGGTWLGKLMDAHPNVLYCWEPDNTFFHKGVNSWHRWNFANPEAYEEACLRHKDHAPLLPVFDKGEITHTVAKVISPVGKNNNLPHDNDGLLPPSEFRRRLTCLDAKFIHLIRHPLRWWASVFRWMKAGWGVKASLEESVRGYINVNIDFFNEHYSDPRYMLVYHEDAVDDTVAVAGQLLEHIGLSIHPQVEDFANTCHRADVRHQKVADHSCEMTKDTVMNRWRSLPAPVIKEINRLTDAYFFDFYEALE